MQTHLCTHKKRLLRMYQCFNYNLVKHERKRYGKNEGSKLKQEAMIQKSAIQDWIFKTDTHYCSDDLHSFIQFPISLLAYTRKRSHEKCMYVCMYPCIHDECTSMYVYFKILLFNYFLHKKETGQEANTKTNAKQFKFQWNKVNLTTRN